MARHSKAGSTSPSRRRFAAIVLGVVGVAGLSIASAAQLTLSSAPLGAGTTIVATCQSTGTITVSFTTAWNTTAPAAYRVTSVTLTGVNVNCAGKPYQIQLVDALGAAIGAPISSATGNVPAGGGTFATAVAAANQQRAQDLGGVSIIIQG